MPGCRHGQGEAGSKLRGGHRGPSLSLRLSTPFSSRMRCGLLLWSGSCQRFIGSAERRSGNPCRKSTSSFGSPSVPLDALRAPLSSLAGFGPFFAAVFLPGGLEGFFLAAFFAAFGFAFATDFCKEIELIFCIHCQPHGALRQRHSLPSKTRIILSSSGFGVQYSF